MDNPSSKISPCIDRDNATITSESLQIRESLGCGIDTSSYSYISRGRDRYIATIIE